jgi:hypothetical protein
LLEENEEKPEVAEQVSKTNTKISRTSKPETENLEQPSNQN